MTFASVTAMSAQVQALLFAISVVFLLVVTYKARTTKSEFFWLGLALTLFVFVFFWLALQNV